jgi:hypothetical protein
MAEPTRVDLPLSADIFRRHLDLTPLRHRARGLVRCRFHDDRTGSLSIDLARGLFNCFGCGTHGGLRRFAELVGERNWSEPRARYWPASPLEEARRKVAQQACREGERAAEWADWHFCSDYIRQARRAGDEARAACGALGPDHPRTWAVLELAARVERHALAVEMELDDILASGRVA